MRWCILFVGIILLIGCTPAPGKYTVTQMRIDDGNSYSRYTIIFLVNDNKISDIKISAFSNTSDKSSMACSGIYYPENESICWNLSCQNCWADNWVQQNTSNGWILSPQYACTNSSTTETCRKYKIYSLRDIEKIAKDYIKTYETKPSVYPWLKDFAAIAKKRSGCNDLICFKGGYITKFRSSPGKDYLLWERKIIWN